ncbi:unnamed protein product [Allacma fusca]|uniref:EGF-like domain-containing protein n=1 Tax=Allacma fusca TaxID=39272 RepID=A0A8J2P4Q5_9HEXA|nr:unnamed protein product [Allacma fusca]
MFPKIGILLVLLVAQGHGLYQGCANSDMCTEPHTYCSKSGFCNCIEGYDPIKVSIYYYCIKRPQEIGGICSVSEDCSTRAICNGTNKCECSEDYVLSPDGKQCLEYATQVGDPCLSPNVCDRLENSLCISGLCTCAAGHIPATNHSRCLQMALHVTDSCEDLPQCSTFLGEGAVCQKGHCYCDFGFTPTQNRNACLPVVHQEGAACVENGQCTAGLGPARCAAAGGVCKCQNGFEPNENNDECV